ncbi:hypothetical protein N7472_009091 [Penicillium cf. griseofulvum]|uniref:Cytochrome P450 n=1 Tax=Penicillium cf. griseofulvum TaxID=2972120 RepID=A0A9W9J5L3_9EURO|nr:hypothetical protein N7472_009091 [Penicillium cf. griseofulvum]
MIFELFANRLFFGILVPLLGLMLLAAVVEASLIRCLLQAYLTWYYPIKSVDGIANVPSCPYRWPNGQGDTGKFFEGIENSVRWETSYGIIYRIWSGMKPEIVLTSPDQLQPVFFDSDQHFKAINNDSGYLLGQLLGQCVGLISPPHWQAVRAVVQLPFLQKACQGKKERIQEIVESFFKNLQEDGKLSNGLIHPTRDLKMLPFWVVCDFFYGQLPTHLAEEMESMVPLREGLMKHAMGGGIVRFRVSRYLPTQANRDLRAFKTQWRRFNREVVAYMRTNKVPAAILHLYDAVDAGKISEDHLLQTLDEAIFANLDVTTGGLSWNLVFLAAYPECQIRLRKEVYQASQSGTLDRYLLSGSTYLQACILESSRLKPLAAFSVPQSAPTDRMVSGYNIPARTNLVVDAYAVNIRNKYWAPDNETYRPDRFLDRNNVELRYIFWRFGFGPRQYVRSYPSWPFEKLTVFLGVWANMPQISSFEQH